MWLVGHCTCRNPIPLRAPPLQKCGYVRPDIPPLVTKHLTVYGDVTDVRHLRAIYSARPSHWGTAIWGTSMPRMGY